MSTTSVSTPQTTTTTWNLDPVHSMPRPFSSGIDLEKDQVIIWCSKEVECTVDQPQFGKHRPAQC